MTTSSTPITLPSLPPPVLIHPSQFITFRTMTPLDLFNINNVNLDPFTENFNTNFYLEYFVNWPELCIIAEAPDSTVVGYIIGKVEGDKPEEWHGHVTALSIAPEFRGSGVGLQLMQILETVSERFKCFFVDLFVRSSNHVAIKFYKKLGYSVYRTIPNYYSTLEDALDMRKPCVRKEGGTNSEKH